MDLDKLKGKITTFLDERDWRQFQTTKDLAASASVESNELLELFLWFDGRETDGKLRSDEGKELLQKVRNETADVLFACLAIAEHLDFSLEEAFLSKLAELENRYSVDKVKGKVVKYPSKE